jgi:filamentous hemagglutinin family protein
MSRIAAKGIPVAVVIAMSTGVRAEVVFDGTAGQPGTLTGPTYNIDASFGTQSGSNLFHSFDAFNINTGETANFNGPATAGVSNVIGRVTGGSPSNIDGTINNNITGASLWLVNPAGIVFGSNASINVSGSFHASTGDSVLFDDGSAFDAVSRNDPALIVANPVGFGFVSNNPGSLVVNNVSLSVPRGQTLSLVGGDVSINGSSLNAADGRLNIAAVNGPGNVLFTDPSANIQPPLTYSGAAGSLSGINMSASSLDVSGNGGGAIYIKGGRFVMDSETVISNNNIVNPGGVTNIDADEMILNQGFVNTESAGSAKGGDITITARRAVLNNNSRLSVASTGTGDAGDVHINVSDELLLNNSRVVGGAPQSGGGNVNIQAVNLVSLVNSDISTQALGVTADTTGGNIFIDPVAVVLNASTLSAQSNSPTNGGNITVSTKAFVRSPTSRVVATSQATLDNQVPLEVLNENVETIPVVTEAFLDVTALLANRCAARQLKSRSSFTLELYESAAPALSDFNYYRFFAYAGQRDDANDSMLLAKGPVFEWGCW